MHDKHGTSRGENSHNNMLHKNNIHHYCLSWIGISLPVIFLYPERIPSLIFSVVEALVVCPDDLVPYATADALASLYTSRDRRISTFVKVVLLACAGGCCSVGGCVGHDAIRFGGVKERRG